MIGGGVIALVGYTLLTQPPDIVPEVRFDDQLLRAAIRLSAGDDFQQVIDNSPPGSTFLIETGTHRLQSIVPRDGDTFIGATGAILNGAQLLDSADFVAEGDLWVFTLSEAPLMWTVGECQPDFPRCNQPYDLYIDDQPLHQSASLDTLTGNRWFLDADNGRIYLAQNPAGHTVEMSSAFDAFSGSAHNVTIASLTVEKYAGPGQHGAIRATETQGWTLYNVIVRLNAGAGVNIGDGMQIIRSQVVNNGQIGISGIGDNVLIAQNEIAHNNYAGYNAGWEAGGSKFVQTDGLLVYGNYVHHNAGPGLWTDIDNIRTRYEKNIVIANQGTGIFHEISYQATIRENVVKFNNPQPTLLFEGAQILISSSRDVTVANNEVVVAATGGNGIGIVQQGRGSGEYGEYFASGNRIHDNMIVFLGDAGQMGGAAGSDMEARFWDEGDNRFERNTYYLPDISYAGWGWENALLGWDDWQSHGQDMDGTVSNELPLTAVQSPLWTPVN